MFRFDFKRDGIGAPEAFLRQVEQVFRIGPVPFRAGKIGVYVNRLLGGVLPDRHFSGAVLLPARGIVQFQRPAVLFPQIEEAHLDRCGCSRTVDDSYRKVRQAA